MKIKRFTAPTIREAMRAVKRELGSDAVILANTATDDGVEIVCAIDYDERLFQEATAPDPETRHPVRETPESRFSSLRGLGRGAAPPQAGYKNPDPLAPREHVAERSAETLGELTVDGVDHFLGHSTASMAEVYHPSLTTGRKTRPVSWSQDPLLKEMRDSLSSLQALLEERLLGMVWQEAAGISPPKTALMSKMVAAGFSGDLARQVIEQLPPNQEHSGGTGFALALLSRQLRTHQPPLLDRGGVWALVGPSGGGKTSTLVKLAARYLDRHGTQSVALVGFDLERIGAHQQLKIYGQLLDVPTRSVARREDLAPTLEELSGHPLILVDTSGFGPTDRQLETQLEIFRHLPNRVNCLLTVPAVMEAHYLRRTLKKAVDNGIGEAVLTRFDETLRPGIGLSSLIEHQLKLCFVGNGRNLTRDLAIANSPEIFSRVATIMLGGQCPPEITSSNTDPNPRIREIAAHGS